MQNKENIAETFLTIENGRYKTIYQKREAAVAKVEIPAKKLYLRTK